MNISENLPFLCKLSCEIVCLSQPKYTCEICGNLHHGFPYANIVLAFIYLRNIVIDVYVATQFIALISIIILMSMTQIDFNDLL